MTTTGPGGADGGGTNLRDLSTPFGSAALHAVRGRSAVPALDDRREPAVGECRRSSTRYAGQPPTTEGAARPHHAARRQDVGRRHLAEPRARRRDASPCATCHSSWITSCFGCHLSQTRQPEAHGAAQRAAIDPQLDAVQLPGPARRRLHARQGWDGGRRPHLAGAVLERRRGELAGSQPPVDLLAAADRLVGGLLRAGVQHARAAHGARRPRPRSAPTATSRPTATTTR